MDDRTLVMVMTNGIGANLTNEEKRAHLTDLRREHLIDKVCIQEILPPDKQLPGDRVGSATLSAIAPFLGYNEAPMAVRTSLYELRELR
jgi:hypothetical protein